MANPNALPASCCLDINTQAGFTAFNKALFESQHEAHVAAAQRRARAAVLWLASASDPEPLTEAERTEIDLAVERWKDSGGPQIDHDARALAFQMGTQWRSS